jgi:hypothetical protein
VDTDGDGVIDKDNCCLCHMGAVKRVTKHMQVEYVFVTNHCDVENSPFFIALDHEKQAVVVCIRGTMSLQVPAVIIIIIIAASKEFVYSVPDVHHLCIVQDLMTDLKARAEHLPLDEARYRYDWLGHRVSILLCHYSAYKLLVRQCFVFISSIRATRGELV